MPGIRVLHVDDEPGFLDLAEAFLERQGLSVVTATSASEGLDLLEREPVDCVVSDYQMPESDGLAFLEAVRERYPDLPFVLFTGEGSESIASDAIAAGVTDYLQKGTGTSQYELLANRIERAVGARRTRRRLDENERMLGALVETLPGVVYRTRIEDGRTVVAEGQVRELTGYDIETFLDGSVDWRDLVHDADLPRVERRVAAAVETGEPFEMAYRIRTRDGRVCRVTNYGHAVPPDDPEAVEGFLVEEGRDRYDVQVRELHDATRRLVAAETPEEVARLTVEAARDVLGYPLNGVRLYDEDSDVLVPVVMSEATDEHIGERPEYDIDDEAYPTLAFREGEPVFVDDVAADDRADGPGGGIGSAMYFPLGEYGTLSVAAPEPGTLGETDRKLAGILADNAAAALERAAREADLEREHDRLAALFENIPDPTAYVRFRDGEPIVEAVNPAFEETFGYGADELRGESLDEFIVPPDRDDEAERYNRQIRGGEGFHGEVRRLAADGLRDFLLHVVPQHGGPADEPTPPGTDPLDDVRGFAIYTDITDRKSYQRELERQNERLEEFASVVSHDLRNPLNVAQGRLEMARETGDDEHFETVERSHDRMRELIDGLLELARQGRQLGETAPVPLGEAVETAWENVDSGEARLVAEELPTVRADRERLCQLLENLLSNAVEHGSTGPDSQARQDTVEHGSTSPDSQARQDAVEHGSTSPDDEHARPVTITVGGLGDGFYVADDGPGIPADEREQVFASGYTTDQDGTGFGLSIVRSIAEAHGWDVAVTECPDGGACFEFTGVTVVD